MTARQREQTLDDRKLTGRPWHTPPFIDSGAGAYLITAACYEHRSHLGHSRARMDAFTEALQMDLIETDSVDELIAWAILPNHYHVLCIAADIGALRIDLGKLHGRTSFQWNKEENQRGRKIWFHAAETAIKSDRHYWATINYIHHNPVKHSCAVNEEDWKWSSIHEWKKGVATKGLSDLKKKFPITEYGKTWDNEDLSTSIPPE